MELRGCSRALPAAFILSNARDTSLDIDYTQIWMSISLIMNSMLRSLAPAMVPVSYLTLSIGAFVLQPYLRMMSLPTTLVLAYLSLRTANYWPGPLDNLWGLLLSIWIAHSTSMELFENPVIWKQVPTPTHPSSTAPTETRRQVSVRLSLWNNPRLIGTPRELKRTGHDAHPPSLLRFTVLRLVKLLAYGLLHIYILPRFFPGLFMPIDITEFGPSRWSILRRLLQPDSATPVTLRELSLRATFVVWWLICTTSVLDAAHAFFSLIAVSLMRFDAPGSWPPIFGPITAAWSLRRFWGKFWHQISVRAHNNYAVAFSRHLLGLRPGSPEQKTLVIFGIFLLSGVTHSVAVWSVGDRCGWSGDMKWFGWNFVAGALEVAVVKVIATLAATYGQSKRWGQFCQSPWGRAVGYSWVFLFLFWSVPRWQYPKLYCRLEDAFVHMRAADGV